jgi:hypothetical protein
MTGTRLAEAILDRSQRMRPGHHHKARSIIGNLSEPRSLVNVNHVQRLHAVDPHW